MVFSFAVRVDNDEITWVDDSKATNVEATYSGLIGFEQKSVLLLGGLAKVKILTGSLMLIQLIVFLSLSQSSQN